MAVLMITQKICIIYHMIAYRECIFYQLMGLVRKNIRYAFLFLDILRKKELKTSVINVKKDRNTQKYSYLSIVLFVYSMTTIFPQS